MKKEILLECSIFYLHVQRDQNICCGLFKIILYVEQGKRGRRGKTGRPGANGLPGQIGETGNKGDPGIQGVKGEQVLVYSLHCILTDKVSYI